MEKKVVGKLESTENKLYIYTGKITVTVKKKIVGKIIGKKRKGVEDIIRKSNKKILGKKR